MTIKELLKQSIENEYINLQALIMFLVLEKKVLSFDDEMKDLYFYTQDKFKDRMNPLISEYKKKLNLKPKERLYEVKTNSETLLIVAKTNDELETFCFLNKIEIESYRPCLLDELYVIGEVFKTAKQLTESSDDKVVGFN